MNHGFSKTAYRSQTFNIIIPKLDNCLNFGISYMQKHKPTKTTIRYLLLNEKKFDLRTFDKEVRKHPFSAKISIKSHKYFYTRSVNFQKKIGKVFNGTYINRIENKELLKYLLKLVCNPILIKNPKKLYWLYKGFKQARDYGF